ncbi:MAG: hypothetical protein ACFFD2_13180 [Promethearchaeota archaeon]
MLEIVLDDLSNWYSNKVRKKIESPRKKVQKILDKIKMLISDINSSCEHLTETTSITEHDELASKSIEQLAKKYQDRINELEIPEEPLYFEKVSKFSLNLKNLIQYLWQQGRRWIPKLSRTTGSTYKTNVREVNYHIKDLQTEWANLEKFIERKLKNVKIYEDIFDQIEKMQTLLDDLDDKKEELKIVESELSQLNDNKSSLEEEYDSINQTPLIFERTTLENELQNIIQTLKSKIGYFRKPFRKFEKLLGEGTYFVRSGCNEHLTNYMKKPLETFFAEQDDYSNLKMVLLELKKAATRLNLKARDEKKLVKEIDEINNGSLLYYRSKYKEYYKKFKDNSKKLENEGLLEELEKLKNKIASVQKDISDIEQKYSRMKDNYDKNLIKMRDLRTYIEKAVQSTTKEEIKIIL